MSLVAGVEGRRAHKVIWRQAENARVFVSRVDWVAVTSGQKREIRVYGHAGGKRDLPHPCVLYSPHPATGEISTALGMVTDRWVEPLGAISSESLELEGFPGDFTGFRRYFAARYPKGGFRPLAKVIVYRLRPMTERDAADVREELWRRLYGQFA